MRIAVVGPTHPIKGGISQHTTALAGRLAEAGHDVELISWRRQYPQRLYPGTQTVEQPEFPAYGRVRRSLNWNRPDGWVREAKKLRDRDLVVFAHATPVQVPPYLAMLRVLKTSSCRTAIVCHNALPHESSRWDEPLVGALFRSADLVVVHSDAEGHAVARLTNTPIRIAKLAPFMPPAFRPNAPAPGVHGRLLFFGIVRPYKGLDILLRALAAGPPEIRLRVVGEFWGGTEATTELCRELDISERVELHPGYAPADEVADYFSDVDALVLPYRAATGSQGAAIGFQFGVPIIATDVAGLADDIRHGVDGLLVSPNDVASLAAAIRGFYSSGSAERMREHVRPIDAEAYWERYLELLIQPVNMGQSRQTVRERASMAARRRILLVAKRGAEELLWWRVAWDRLVRRSERDVRTLPEYAPSALLSTATQYMEAVDVCKELHLPLHHDRPKNWDALGAVSVVVKTLGTDIRVLDAGAASYSPVLPWLHMFGVHGLVGMNLEFEKTTFRGCGRVRMEPGDITQTGYPDGFFDAITCMSVIEHGVPMGAFFREAARILRAGGLLVISTDYDRCPPDTTGKFAYGAPVKVFGPDEIQRLVEMATDHELELVGDLMFDHKERPVHWRRTGLNYTFIRLSFLKRGPTEL